MPKLLRVRLQPSQQAQLRTRLSQPALAPVPGAGLACVRLSHQGWTVRQIAEHQQVCQVTVRRTLHRFVAGGLDALADRPRSGRLPTLSSSDLDAVERLLWQAARHGERWKSC